jgi:hypothetical protein
LASENEPVEQSDTVSLFSSNETVNNSNTLIEEQTQGEPADDEQDSQMSDSVIVPYSVEGFIVPDSVDGSDHDLWSPAIYPPSPGDDCPSPDSCYHVTQNGMIHFLFLM